MTSSDDLLAIAEAAAWAAGRELLQRYRRNEGVESKRSSVDLVSDADRASELRIRSLITTCRPRDEIVGEEYEQSEGTSGIYWLVDPLDGTYNYLQQIPMWCVSIAACDSDGPIAGVVFDPLHGETFSAARGRGARLNGAQLELEDDGTAPKTLIGSFRRAVEPGHPRAAELLRFAGGFGSTREVIAGALELAWTAARRIDVLYHESRMQAWDKAAGILLCSEVGLGVEEYPPASDGRRPRLLVAHPAVIEGLRDQVAPDVRDQPR